MVTLPHSWLTEEISTQNGGKSPRWKASGFVSTAPSDAVVVPVRHLRVLYTLEDTLYKRWIEEHIAAGHEYFCSHSSLGSYKSQKMQSFLRRLDPDAHFYT